MKKLKVVLDEGAKMPTRAHNTDAGIDMYAKNSATVDDIIGLTALAYG